MSKKPPIKAQAKPRVKRGAKKAKRVPPKPTGTEPKATVAPKITVDPSELNHLVTLKHADPHRILGPHLSEDGVSIRAFRPEAESVEVVVGKKRPQPMAKTHAAGLFEILLRDLAQVPSYRFNVHEPDGQLVALRDPYSFPPTLGELDLHLFAEGRHEAIYEKLGVETRTAAVMRAMATRH